MIRRALVAGSFVLLCRAPLAAQSITPGQELHGALPPDEKVDQFALTGDGQRTYFTNTAGELWLYDRTRRTTARLTNGPVWDLNLSPAGDALAYTKAGATHVDQYVWVLRLNRETGLASGPDRRLSRQHGDVPSISPDGQLVAFARDDSTGVGQSVVVVSTNGGAERVIAPSLPSSVGSIRWTPDGKTLYFGVNPPVACVPDWSCLPLAKDNRPPPGTIRRAAASGGAVTVVASARGVLPGLSPDGTTLMYLDTSVARRWVVADANGNRRDTLSLPTGKAPAGWLRGSTVLFQSGGVARAMHIMSLADGGARVRLENPEAINPAWSPDGTVLSVIGRATPHSELRILNPDGSVQKTVPLPDNFGTGSVWSPDQRWVAYVGYADNTPPHVATVEVGTGRIVRLADLGPDGSATIRWLADSRSVIISEMLDGDGNDRRVSFRQVDLNGNVTLLRDLPVGPTPSAGAAVDASTAIIHRNKPNDYRLIRLNGDTSERVILPDTTGVSSIPSLSADGQWFAVRRNLTGSDNAHMNVLELLRGDGASRTTIALPFFAAPGNNNPLILGGGRDLLVTEARRQDAEPGVYLVNVATRSVQKLFGYTAQYPPPEIAASSATRTIAYIGWEVLPPAVFSLDLSSLHGANIR